ALGHPRASPRLLHPRRRRLRRRLRRAHRRAPDPRAYGAECPKGSPVSGLAGGSLPPTGGQAQAHIPPSHLAVGIIRRTRAAAARPKADAIVTKSEGLAISVTTADCAPVLCVDPTARVIGAAHAGWKGALTGILESTIDAMEKLGADRSGMVAAIGPLIRQPS